MTRFSLKITVIVFITVMVASITLAGVFDKVRTRAVENLLLETNERAARNVGEQLHTHLQQVVGSLKTIAASSQLGVSQEYFELSQKLTPQIDALLLFNGEGFIVMSSGPAAPTSSPQAKLSYAYREYFQRAFNGEDYISDTFLSTTGQKVVAISVPWRNSEGQVIGVVAGIMRLRANNMVALFDGKTFGRRGYIMVSDVMGEVIYHTVPERIGITRTIEDTAWPLIEAGKGRGRFTNDFGEDLYTGIYRIPGMSWIVYVQTPVSEVAVIRQQALVQGSFAMLVVAIVMVGLSVATVQKVTRPLTTLTQAFDELGKGIYRQIGVEKTGDEFQALMEDYNATVADLAATHHKLEGWAERDGLTGAYNRRVLDRVLSLLEKDFHTGKVTSAAFLFVDVDHFKKYNDIKGHLAGDDLLKQLVDIMRDVAGDRSVYRYGGEEFSILLRDVSREYSLELAESLRKRALQTLECTISIGVARLPESASTVSDLVEQADQAMYLAKQTRNTVCHI